jgi:hypothetical protein
MSGSNREEGVWIQTGNPFTVSEASPFAPGQIGKVSNFANSPQVNGVTGQSPILIQAVRRYATDTVAITTQGDVAFWQDTDNYVVTSQAANAIGGTTAPLLAGVFGATNLTLGSYGFIQVGGVGVVRVSDSTTAATVGANLVWSTNNLVAQELGAATTAVTKQVLGVLRTLNTATTTNLSVEALITVGHHSW